MPDKTKEKVAKFSLNLKSIDKIQTEESEDGLLIKGLPVFKAGQHRGDVFSRDYIDRNLIGQFSPDDDVPLQADHSPSFLDTLGFIKNLKREGDFLVADVLLKDDNAIARWKKGLMKKFSAGIDLMKDKLREVSAVAFPFIKEAAVHTQDVDYQVYEGTPDELNVEAEGDEPIHVVKEKEKTGPAKEEDELTLEKKPEKTDEELGLVIKIEDDGSKEEVLGINSEDIVNLHFKNDFIDSEELKPSDLPDSAFLLTKRPIENKSRDRKFPIRNSEEKIVLSAVRFALENIKKAKDFSEEIRERGTKLLEALVSKHENRKRVAEKSGSARRIRKMSLKDIKLSEFEGEVKELLEEAIENQENLETEIQEKEAKLAEVKEKNKELEDNLKKADVEAKIEKLASDGKITPAQKEKTTELLMSMDEAQITSYVELMEGTKPIVTLGEDENSGEEGSEEVGSGESLDIENLSAEELNTTAEKLAKEHDVEFSTALDWVYDGVVDSNGKLKKVSE